MRGQKYHEGRPKNRSGDTREKRDEMSVRNFFEEVCIQTRLRLDGEFEGMVENILRG
jgi:hypothetical protein